MEPAIFSVTPRATQWGPHVAGVPASAAQEWDPWGARASGAPGDFTNWGYYGDILRHGGPKTLKFIFAYFCHGSEAGALWETRMTRTNCRPNLVN
jgi:hypothetical protein